MLRRVQTFFSEPLQQARDEQRAHLQALDGRLDWQTMWVLVSAALLLTARSYFFDSRDLRLLLAVLARWWPEAPALLTGEHQQFVRLCYWCFGQNFTYVVLPLLLIVLVFRHPVVDYGVKLRGMTRFWWLYLGMFLVMTPLIAWLSTTESFQRTYPFYQLAPGERWWPKLCCWELLYASQFVALEFFFRGFMVHGTRRQFGVYSVFVMAVPYCMIHFGKPLPETIGAVVAGVVLGFMSLKTRSIWMGAALHIAVAWSMDLAALASR